MGVAVRDRGVVGLLLVLGILAFAGWWRRTHRPGDHLPLSSSLDKALRDVPGDMLKYSVRLAILGAIAYVLAPFAAILWQNKGGEVKSVDSTRAPIATFAADSLLLKQDASMRLVALAIDVLREHPESQNLAVRRWATDILDAYSGVKLSASARQQLIDSLRPLVARRAVRVATSSVTVRLQVNNSRGPWKLRVPGTFGISWASTGATACQQLSPALSGTSTDGAMLIPEEHPYYPAPHDTMMFKIVCTDGTSNAVDSVLVFRSL